MFSRICDFIQLECVMEKVEKGQQSTCEGKGIKRDGETCKPFPSKWMIEAPPDFNQVPDFWRNCLYILEAITYSK